MSSPMATTHPITADNSEGRNGTAPGSTSASFGLVATDAICFQWYHKGTCSKFPTDPKSPLSPCPYRHAMPNPAEPQHLSRGSHRYMHKAACGLSLCKWKDAAWAKKPKTPLADSLLSALTASMKSTSRRSKRKAKAQPAAQSKRKAELIRHRDEPTLWSYKRVKLSYDEDEDEDEDGGMPMVSSPVMPKDVASHRIESSVPSTVTPMPAIQETTPNSSLTCFFWYHGHCGRSRAGDCDYNYGMTSPPTRVRPPPEYMHKTPCELPWCSGDGGRAPSSGKKRKRQGERQVNMKRSVLARAEIPDVDDASSDASETPSCGQIEEWHLQGFE